MDRYKQLEKEYKGHRPWEVSKQLIIQMLVDGFGYEFIEFDDYIDMFVYRDEKGRVVLSTSVGLLHYLNHGKSI